MPPDPPRSSVNNKHYHPTIARESTGRGAVKKNVKMSRRKAETRVVINSGGRGREGDEGGGEARVGARCYLVIGLLRTHTEAAIQRPDPASIAPATGPHFQSRYETKGGPWGWRVAGPKEQRGGHLAAGEGRRAGYHSSRRRCGPDPPHMLSIPTPAC